MSNVDPSTEQAAADAGIQLTAEQRAFGQALLANPVDFPPNMQSWIEDKILQMLSAYNIAGLEAFINAKAITATVGQMKIVAKDYSAQTGVYTVSDDQGDWLYCNGASASQSTYADLYAYLGANAYGADSGGNFVLPDARGRSIWMTGTHTATDLGDTDGVAESSRQPKHTHTSSHNFSIGNESAHTHTAGTYQTGSIVQGITSNVLDKSGDDAGAEPFAPSSTSNISGSSGAGSAHTHPLNGGITAIGSGMSGSDAVAHIIIGSLLIKT